MRNARLRAMQACVRSLIMFCKDKQFFKTFLARSKQEGLYPFGVSWKQLRIDKRQSRKNDLLNWVFAFVSFEPYAWLVWYLWTPLRNKHGIETFDMEDFNDAV